MYLKTLKRSKLSDVFAMLRRQVSSYVHHIAKFANAKQRFMDTMRITTSLSKSFGCVANVISITINNIDFTLNDLTRRLRKEMRKSELVRKPLEGNPKRFPRQLWLVTKVTERTNDLWIQNLRSTGI
jgi:hypothetical protein